MPAALAAHFATKATIGKAALARACADENDARAFEEKEKAEARIVVTTDEAQRRGPLTIESAAHRWWEEHGSTLSDFAIKSALERVVDIIGPKTFLHSINDDTVSRMVVERRKDLRRDRTVTDKDGKKTILYRPVSNATVNRSIDLLRRVMNRAYDNWNASIQRMPKWSKHRLKETRIHVRELTKAEERTLDQAESFDYAELRRFMILTGLRRRSAIIRWPQVDFELGVIRVMAKGGVPRIIPMTPEIYAMLWRRKGHHSEFVFTYKAKHTSKRSQRAGGERIKDKRYPITYSGMGSNKRRKWAKAGVKARIHDLRHTAGSRVTRKRGIRQAQILLGHTTIAITARFYSAIDVDDLRDAMEAAGERDATEAAETQATPPKTK